MSTVGEVTELRFPQHQRVLSLQRVPILEPECGILRQQGVVDPESTLLFAEVEQWEPLLAVHPVMENSVTRGKGAAACVLTGDTHRGAFGKQRTEREQFAEAPIDASLAAHVPALLDELLEFAMHLEARGFVLIRVTDQLDRGAIDRGVELLLRFARAGFGGVRDGSNWRRGRLRSVRLLKRTLELGVEALLGFFVLFFGDVATTDECLGVQLSRGLLRLDEVVHQRLGHRWIVALVVPAAAIADEVDDDILMELLPELESEFRDVHDRLRVIPVHVEDRRLDGLADVTRVHGTARVHRQGGETDLVIDDDVDRAARAVSAQLRHLQGFVDDPLARECGVTVHQHRERCERTYGFEVLLCAHHTRQHSVHHLKV